MLLTLTLFLSYVANEHANRRPLFARTLGWWGGLLAGLVLANTSHSFPCFCAFRFDFFLGRVVLEVADDAVAARNLFGEAGGKKALKVRAFFVPLVPLAGWDVPVGEVAGGVAEGPCEDSDGGVWEAEDLGVAVEVVAEYRQFRPRWVRGFYGFCLTASWVRVYEPMRQGSYEHGG